MTHSSRLIMATALACVVALSSPSYAGMNEAGEAMAAGNFKLAMKEFLPIARGGDAKAQAVIGLMYEDGMGVAKDRGQAAYWYEQSANNGRYESQHLLGMLHLGQPGEDFQPSLEKGFFWMKKAAEQGNANSQVQLGRMYQSGQGVVANPRRGVTWFRAAADQGHKDAQLQLAYAYQQGNGVERNDEQAYFWALVSAAGGNKSAAQVIPSIAPELPPQVKSSIRERVARWQQEQVAGDRLQGLSIDAR